MSFGVSAIAILAVGTQVVSAVGQYQAAQEQKEALQKQGEAQERQYAAQQKAADIANVRTARQSIREARAKRALILNVAAGSGTMGSSGAVGGVSSVGSQLGANYAYSTAVGEAQQEEKAAAIDIGQAATEAGQAAATGAQWGALGSLGSTIFANAPKLAGLGTKSPGAA